MKFKKTDSKWWWVKSHYYFGKNDTGYKFWYAGHYLKYKTGYDGNLEHYSKDRHGWCLGKDPTVM